MHVRFRAMQVLGGELASLTIACDRDGSCQSVLHVPHQVPHCCHGCDPGCDRLCFVTPYTTVTMLLLCAVHT